MIANLGNTLAMDMITQLKFKLMNPELSVEHKLQQICLTTISLIQKADKVSLWRFDKDKSFIDSIIVLDNTKGTFFSDQRIYRSDVPDYFNAITKKKFVNAPDAFTHEDTKAFKDFYLVPQNICSMLDYILYRDYSPSGVICCESIGRQSVWTKEDEAYLKQIAMAASLFFDLN